MLFPPEYIFFALCDTPPFSRALVPPVIWAQRNDIVFVTINLNDINHEKYSLDNKKLTFSGIGGSDKKFYSIELEFNKEVVPEVCGVEESPSARVLAINRLCTFVRFVAAIEKQENGQRANFYHQEARFWVLAPLTSHNAESKWPLRVQPCPYFKSVYSHTSSALILTDGRMRTRADQMRTISTIVVLTA